MNTHALDMAAYESLLAFWRDAGVDACYLDEPADHTKILPMPTPAAVQKLATVAPARTPAGTTNAAQGVALAREMAASAQSLDELIEAVSRFDGCGLKKMGARNALFGRGAANAELLVIGDAPTTDDDNTGRAFSGPAGQMLDKILAAGNLTERAYLTQSVFWNPPGNRAPTPDEQAVCLPFIERAIQIIKPKAVLLIGGVAVRAVLNSDENLLRLQGQWREWTTHDGVNLPVMTTFHPGFLLQQPQAKRLVWQSILATCTRLSTTNIEERP